MFFVGAFCVLTFQLHISHLLENMEAVARWKKVVLKSKLLIDLLEKDVW